VSGRRYRGTWSISGKPPEYFLLDKFSIADIKKWTELQDAILKYHWDYYSDLAYLRSKIDDELKKALLESAEKSFEFSRWQRVVKYKYALQPLSVDGSLVDPGGRFNIGDINPAQCFFSCHCEPARGGEAIPWFIAITLSSVSGKEPR